MLVAEIHGKTLEVARDSEDYLTSTVFGHLRYVPPGLFWPTLFATAKGLPGPDGGETSLLQALAAGGIGVTKYERLEARFWRSHPTLGEPDLLLLFSGGPQPPLVVLIEAKLWSGKSGVEENDQLVRYLDILDDLDVAGVNVPAEAGRYLVYLTPRESLGEAEDSLAWSNHKERDRKRLFRLQWQDVLVAARRSAADAPEPARTILADVAAFLARLGLEYFAGFSRVAGLPVLPEADGIIFKSWGVSAENPLTRLPGLEPITVRSASWAK